MEETVNPAAMLKLMGAKKVFERNHPKFVAFAKSQLSKGIAAGTVIGITVERPGEKPVVANIRVQQSDLKLLEVLRELEEGNNENAF